jgi:hypothetical protein
MLLPGDDAGRHRHQPPHPTRENQHPREPAGMTWQWTGLAFSPLTLLPTGSTPHTGRIPPWIAPRVRAAGPCLTPPRPPPRHDPALCRSTACGQRGGYARRSCPGHGGPRLRSSRSAPGQERRPVTGRPRLSRLAFSLTVRWLLLSLVFWLLGRALDQPAALAQCPASAAFLVGLGEAGDLLRRRWRTGRSTSRLELPPSRPRPLDAWRVLLRGTAQPAGRISCLPYGHRVSQE